MRKIVVGFIVLISLLAALSVIQQAWPDGRVCEFYQPSRYDKEYCGEHCLKLRHCHIGGDRR
jgi:hypothetical protein